MPNVYILGSGFSASCGLPTLINLFPEILKYNRPGEEDVENVHDGLEFLYPHFNPKNPGKYPPFEEFLSLVKISEEFGAEGLEPGSFEKGYWLEKYKSSLRLLTDCINEYQSTILKENKDKAIRFFIDNLKNGDTIITFNWDTLIETILSEKEITFSLTERLPSGVSIFKLHGSLSWQLLPKGVVPKHPEYYQSLSEDGKLLFRKDHHYVDLWDALDESPYIVAPVSNKTPFENRFIKKIWHESFDSLIEAEKIVVIGYSLPPEDLHARSLIRSGVLWNDSIKRSLLLIDPNPEIAGRFFSTITPNLRYFQRYFSEEVFTEILNY